MLKTLAIEISDKRFFCGWQNFQHKQGRVAVFAKDDAKIYHEESAAEIDMKLLRKRGHRPTLRALDAAPAQAIEGEGNQAQRQ